jgi:hypothetical protein
MTLPNVGRRTSTGNPMRFWKQTMHFDVAHPVPSIFSAVILCQIRPEGWQARPLQSQPDSCISHCSTRWRASRWTLRTHIPVSCIVLARHSTWPGSQIWNLSLTKRLRELSLTNPDSSFRPQRRGHGDEVAWHHRPPPMAHSDLLRWHCVTSAVVICFF